MSASRNRNPIYDLGLLDYEEAFVLQKELGRRRAEDEIPDTILLLEHRPVVTIGSFVRPGEEDAEIRVPREHLSRGGIRLIRTDRGGRLTYHGPGQLVVYPILHLRQRGLSVRAYVRGLEESIMRTLSDFGIEANRKEGLVGVWAGRAKIGSIGLKVERWVSRHGLALNVNMHLSAFRYIVPCGLAEGEVTSMSKLLGKRIEMAAVKKSMVRSLASQFHLNVHAGWAVGEYFSPSADPWTVETTDTLMG